jgi:hypothetical protein
MNIKFASLILAVTFVATACADPDPSSSGRQDLDDRVLIDNTTSTPTATVPPPLVIGLEFEPTTVLSPYPTETPHPLIDTNFDPIPLPWFDWPNWHWFPVTMP